MKTYTVAEISETLDVTRETVRRWIRSGSLKATQASKKTGNVINEQDLFIFVRRNPKYKSKVNIPEEKKKTMKLLVVEMPATKLDCPFVKEYSMDFPDVNYDSIYRYQMYDCSITKATCDLSCGACSALEVLGRYLND